MSKHRSLRASSITEPVAKQADSNIKAPYPGHMFDYILRVHEVARMCGVSVPTVWRWVRSRNDFPKPRKLGPRTTGWRASEVMAFLSMHDRADS